MSDAKLPRDQLKLTVIGRKNGRNKCAEVKQQERKTE